MANYDYERLAPNTATFNQVQPFMDLVSLRLGANTNWRRVDRVTNGAAVAEVFACGPGNAHGGTFHVVLARTSATGSAVFVAVAEGYSATAQAVSRPVLAFANADLSEPAVDGSVGGGQEFPLFTAPAVVNPALLWRSIPMTGASSMDSWTYVSANNLYLAVGPVGQAKAFYAFGLFESFVPLEPFPLFSGWSGGISGLSRMPYVVVPQAGNWQTDKAMLATRWTLTAGTLNGFGDRLFNHRPIASRLLVRHAGAPTTHGSLRGLYRDLLSFDTSTPVAQLGDTVTINDENWVVLHQSGSIAVVANLTRP